MRPRPSLPSLIMTAFAAMAIAAIGLGCWFAKGEWIERIERDRGAREQLAAELSAELRRLDELYTAHLRALGSKGKTDTGAGFAAACRNIIGVRHYSRLHPKPDGKDLQLDFRAPGEPAVSAPVFKGGTLFPSVPRREMMPQQFFGRSSADGTWLREGGRPALFFTEADDVVHVFSIDEAEVRAAVNGWIAAWASERFKALGGDGMNDRISGPDKAILLASKNVADAPDWLVPARSQFGTWRIESWDERVIHPTWHVPILTGAIGVAVLAIVGGWSLATRARQERQRAEQRVSFVNRVSHELRAPLTNILLNLDLAAEEVAESEASRRLKLAQEEAGRLGRLIDNVLTFSRQERQQLTLQPRACVPGGVLGAVIDQFEPAFKRRDIVIHRSLTAERACLIDPDALAQIVANLLSNVEKYVPAGTVHFSAEYESETLVVLVADDGPGVPAAAVERVFLPFERLDSRTSEGVTGTGLGLAIARDLAARLGGALRLIPASRGASFELRVPAPPLPELQSSVA